MTVIHLESPPAPTIKEYIAYTIRKALSIVKAFFEVILMPYLALFQSFWPESIDDRVKEHAIEQLYHPGGDRRVGILLVHGFAAAPDIFRDFIPKLGALGYVVRTVRIEGHGTSPAHFATTTAVDWYLSVRRRFLELKDTCDKVVIVAHSLGALISIVLASIYEVNSMVFLSPPLKLRDTPLFRVNFLLRPVSKLVKYWPTDKRMMKNVEKFHFKIYDKHPLAAVANLIDMIAIANKRLPKVTCPILAMIGDRDEFAEPLVLDMIEQNSGSKHVEKWVVPGAPHAIIDCADQEELKDRIKDFLLRTTPPE